MLIHTRRFRWTLKPPVVGCLAGRPPYLMIQEKPLRNKVFLPLSTINSVVGEKSMEDVESFSWECMTSVESNTIITYIR